MVAIELRFPGGRFHATPWDRHVNEGAVEWPPSPWRFLRALIATWYLKARDEVDEIVMQGLVEKLSAPPSFHLPPAIAAHTRHYMPLYKSGTTKVFDAFVRMDSETPLTMTFDGVSLTAQEREALEVLLSRLGYLGRAESWVDARLAKDSPVALNSVPVGEGAVIGDEYEVLRLLAATAPEPYSKWKDAQHGLDGSPEEMSGTFLAEASNAPSGEKASRRRRTLRGGGELPSSLFEALQADTSSLKEQGWSQPPGSTWLTYTRPRNVFSKAVATKPRTASAGALEPKFAVFRVVSNAPPRLTEALSLAERIHVALVKWSDGSPVFTGCDENGVPLNGNSHAYILPESRLSPGSGVRGEVTHVTVFAPMGFGHRERKAIEGVRRVWGHGGNDIQLVLLGIGGRDDIGGASTDGGRPAPLGTSKVWVSRTPFVPTRHPKMTRAGKAKVDGSGYQIGSPLHDMRRLLLCSGFPEPVTITHLESTDLAGRSIRWIEFRRDRSSGGGRRATNLGFGFRIEFPSDVAGPIALGYGAHFGLGQFEPLG